MHEIMEHDKQQGREMAWHKLTEVVPLLELLSCWLSLWDYTPKPLPLPNGKPSPWDILGVTDVEDLTVGKPYDRGSFKPITNKRLIDILEKGIAGKDLVLASCGTVKNRGRQFFSFQMGEAYKAADRQFVPFFNVGNGNDMSSKLWPNTSNTCTVCNNTFDFNAQSAGIIMEVKKTKFSEPRVEDFGRAISAMLGEQTEWAKLFEQLARIKASEDTAREFFAGFLSTGKALSTRAENTIERLVCLFKDQSKGNSGVNFADVFSALTDYYSHESSGGENTWKQFVSSEFGSGNAEKIRAWALITDKSKREALVKIGRETLKRTADLEKALAAANG